ncbi:MAG: DUF192 domain-containing protein [Candidatus Aenigmarchaeota archaeon]|nr:DUF192 domain-containing protein [Candidatus Aenigmarchaeota archaeon]
MKIKINKKIIEVKDCRGLSSVRGMMFDKKSKGALIRGNSIWMPFVSTSLCLLFLDNNYKLIEVQEAVPMTLNPKTWKVYNCNRAAYCLELRKGIIKNPVSVVIA